jgi:hypothetical protein
MFMSMLATLRRIISNSFKFSQPDKLQEHRYFFLAFTNANTGNFLYTKEEHRGPFLFFLVCCFSHISLAGITPAPALSKGITHG